MIAEEQEKRRKEEVARRAEENQRKEQLRQRLQQEESKQQEKMAGAKRQREAGLCLLSCLQRLCVATPETFELLAKESESIMKEHGPSLGDLAREARGGGGAGSE